MRNSSPKQLAFFIASLASIISTASVFTIQVYTSTYFIVILLPSMVLSFGIVYFVALYIIKYLILEKIDPIYKTIRNVTLDEKAIKRDLDDKDMIRAVEKDVIIWAKTKKKEIADLKNLEKYRKEFLGNVMHELKTPIFNMQGYVLTLLDGGLEDKTINRSYLERTEKSINRMISIVEDLESISRLESGELKLELTHFDIVKLFEESFEMHDMMSGKMKIKLKFNSNYEKPIVVNADRNRIMEVVNNLIVNSIKYGKKGGATKVGFMDMGDNILVEITDTGIGIKEDHIPRLFERFYRVDKSRSREQGGTGLGLAIVKHIIEAHSQRINVRSELNVGTSFTFTLKKGKKSKA